MKKSSSSKNTAQQTTPQNKRAAGVSARAIARSRDRSDEPFAVTCEGSVYVNIDALSALDQLFIGAELGRGERRLARELFDSAGHELGAKIAGPLRRRRAARTKPA
jgi:hypothetical protein